MAAKPIEHQYLCTLYNLKQHRGECWHDAYATMMLFTDGIKEIIQDIPKTETPKAAAPEAAPDKAAE